MGKTIMYERIYADLLAKIQNGDYQPGDRLPSEKESAELYGVSRITAKKAMDMLAKEKKISREPGRGSFVCSPAAAVEMKKESRGTANQRIGVIFDGFGSDFGTRLLQGISIPCVRTDNYEAANEVTKILIAMGHKKICFLTHASVTTTTIHERYEGFAHCMLKYEDANGTFAKLEKYNHIPEDIEKECREFDYAQIAEILEKNRECTAYIAAEYRIGVLFSKYLKEHGISKKIAVFDGIDEIYEQDDFIHVRQNEFAMGQQAVTLLEEITTGKKQNEDIIIPYQISGIL